MLASRPDSRPRTGIFAGLGERRANTGERTPPVGWRRLLVSYEASGLAVVLGLPGLAAGLITANTCQLRAMDCVGSSAYGLIGGAGLALIIQLVLAVQLRLGWRFWLVSLFGVVAAWCGIGSLWLLVPAIALVPAAAGWITDPRRWRPSGWRRWFQRVGALVLMPIVTFTAGLLTGGIGLPVA